MLPRRKNKPVRKLTKRAAARSKAGVKFSKAANLKKSARAKPAAKRPPSAKKLDALDLSAFPPESVNTVEKWLCLACVLDVFTRHLRLAPRTAHLEIKRYTPSIPELYTPTPGRPWFASPSDQNRCPYCGSSSKWLARIRAYRIESSKATDVPRRDLLRSLPQADDQCVIVEEKATRQHAFFEWLDKVSGGLDLEDPAWLRKISQHYLSRKEPKIDWQAKFGQIHSIRRSRRVESGWEIENGHLFLAPLLFDELLLVQYLVSRSHRSGGLTLEGRYTLPELISRLRNAGYLRVSGIHAHNPSDALEQLITYLGGGEAGIKFYHIVDRREFLEQVRTLRLMKPPKLKV
jgi:hypothetical protein